MKVPCLVIGGGLSGLAAAIRLARYIPGIVLVEQHSRLGGLNSYYHRNNTLIETGLHAITNYAEAGNKKAPLNRLLRQLKIPRDRIDFLQQQTSAIHFPDNQVLHFSNDPTLFTEEIRQNFPKAVDRFMNLQRFLDTFDPFAIAPFRSARSFLHDLLGDELLVDMILCPLMYYGSSTEDDMDLSQFAIMFQAIFREGFFRPRGTMRDFLQILSSHLTELGGEIRMGARVEAIWKTADQGTGVRLASGESIECDFLLSTIGIQETGTLLGQPPVEETGNRLGFVESIFQVPASMARQLPADRTITFFSRQHPFCYRQPEEAVDFNSGVICLPHNFQGNVCGNIIEVRTTHLANYERWRQLRENPEMYQQHKQKMRSRSLDAIEHLLGNFRDQIVYEDSFTPLTIERYTAKHQGAIYGSPAKIKDGTLGYDNIFLAGTDQGFLGIVGSMLSGVSIVNQHILPHL